MASAAHTRPGRCRLRRSASLVPLLMLALRSASGFTTMQSFGIMAESAKARARPVGRRRLALIQGVSAAVPLVLFSIPIGILVDRTNRVRLLIAARADLDRRHLPDRARAQRLASCSSARMLTGIGTTGALTAALSLSADLCLPEQRGRAHADRHAGQEPRHRRRASRSPGWLLGLFAAAGAPQLVRRHRAVAQRAMDARHRQPRC